MNTQKVCLILLSLLLIAISPPNSAFSSGYYGPPYDDQATDTPATPAHSVDAAINNWWEAYKRLYPIAKTKCSFERTYYQDGRVTGHFASMRLTGSCSGGQSIVGTFYQLDSKRNIGHPSCN